MLGVELCVVSAGEGPRLLRVQPLIVTRSLNREGGIDGQTEMGKEIFLKEKRALRICMPSCANKLT